MKTKEVRAEKYLILSKNIGPEQNIGETGLSNEEFTNNSGYAGQQSKLCRPTIFQKSIPFPAEDVITESGIKKELPSFRTEAPKKMAATYSPTVTQYHRRGRA